jgi:hypothetical protein
VADDRHIPPHEREGIPYSALETTRAFDRLPHSFLAPDDPSVFPPGPRLNRNALQAFANVAAASVLRLGALDCTTALHPLPTGRQGAVAADMATVLGELSPLPPELCRYIVELSRGATLRRVASPRAPASDQPDSDSGECEMGSECCQNTRGALGLGGRGVELAPQATLTPNPEAGPSQRKRRATESAEGIERAVARARTPVSADVSGGRQSPLRMESPEPEAGETEHRPLDEHDLDHMPPLVPGQRARGGIDWDSLDAVLDRLAVFVPVTPGEMDALVAAQIQDDSAPYQAEGELTASPQAMETDDEEEEEEGTPLRTLADEYDSDAESDIVD